MMAESASASHLTQDAVLTQSVETAGCAYGALLGLALGMCPGGPALVHHITDRAGCGRCFGCVGATAELPTVVPNLLQNVRFAGLDSDQ